MKLEFDHRGTIRTLAKNPKIAQQLKRGELTEAQARTKPWVLRFKVGDRERAFTLSCQDKQAIADAKDILNGRQNEPETFSKFVAALDAKRGLTVDALAKEWLELGLPDAKGRARAGKPAAALRAFTTAALRWWTGRRLNAVSRQTMNEFAAWRRQHTPRGQGDSSTDHELTTLSNLCQWAVGAGKLDANPFAKREKYRLAEDINKCHLHMPDDDQQLHAILKWLWADPANEVRIIAGAWLCFCTLSGLRPGEPATLQRVPPADKFPPNLDAAAPGLSYPMPDGTRRMKVARLKRGQNPAIILHPVLTDFLNVWTAWLALHRPLASSLSAGGEGRGEVALLFPLSNPDALNDQLDRACRALNLREMKPHGFGRAYYVRVRRSQGIDDAAIASELGQSTNGELIRSVYGAPKDPVGGQLHDWLPADAAGKSVPAAWHQLTPAGHVSGPVAPEPETDTKRDTDRDTSKFPKVGLGIGVGWPSRN